ncbi:Der GTPase-activating protein YihI [Pseudidiomarina andamanensis]|uniref:GTPase-activating protein n=1 Tax=Pseudidiomarina andamanensis TaxID=1940690 RepID=A0AA92IMD1_9GAMM|nr:Der GTPase-activating protein YihI [Pseudidiomarina andamanensis]MDS0218969.1 Der GTPase-activating protein YihI [Pseudidiomarina andamanensis]QGT96328.1 GTPase-activating protein [Pseudidiomarina andamanensis]
MTRVKKTRKTGPLAPSKKPQKDWEQPKTKSAPSKPTHKTKGHKPGSRFNPPSNQGKRQEASGNSQAHDPRHGSKKPISLIDPKQAAQMPQPPSFDRKAAMAELTSIENDERLQALLERAEDGESLSAVDTKYMEERTERFSQLAEILGIELEDDDDFDDLDFDDEFEDDDERS